MNRLFIRDVEEIREFVKLHSENEVPFDRILSKLMRK